MTRAFLMISDHPDSSWAEAVGAALRPIGELQVTSEREAQHRIKLQRYDLTMIDASAVSGDVPTLVAQIHKERPDVPIIVATTSPTWQRARQIFLAGATDYIRRSLDTEKILAGFQEILDRSSGIPTVLRDIKEDDHAQADDSPGR